MPHTSASLSTEISSEEIFRSEVEVSDVPMKSSPVGGETQRRLDEGGFVKLVGESGKQE